DGNQAAGYVPVSDAMGVMTWTDPALLPKDDGDWTVSGSDMYSSVSGNIGIGTTTPGYKLQVGESGDGTQARANAWNTFSDLRWKRDLAIIDDPLEKLEQLYGYYYYWNRDKKDQSRQVGVVAQEVETVLPEIVSTDAEGMKSVDYTKLTAVLIEAVKELQEENQALREELTGRIEALESE
ncbi:MAG: tail fiber domain-containing protein, partial [Bacteroidetes bacterium]|nr:tail fiber domain-containing protein [Bacteroidota bacterium]